MGVVTRAKKRRLQEEEEEEELLAGRRRDAILASPTMGVVTRAKKRRLQEEEEELLADRISSLPDDVLGDIVSLLPTKDGARTQILSSRWRNVWRSAPLNLDLHDDPAADGNGGILVSDIVSCVLSTHPGPGRRFVMPCPRYGKEYPPSTATLDGWLRSPALDNLQEHQLEFRYSMLPPSIHRLSPTLRVVVFTDICFTPGTGTTPPLHWPLLKQLTLSHFGILETSLHALLAGCPVLESFLLFRSGYFCRLQIVSSSLRSIGVGYCYWDYKITSQQLVIEDAPRLERLLYFGGEVNISVISAPRLAILGKLFKASPGLQFGATVFQGSTIVSMSTVVPSVKVLTLCHVNLCMDAILKLMQCFPHLHKLYIKLTLVLGKAWSTYRKLNRTLDIGLRKIVLSNYRGSNKSHINLARFFVSNARELESMRFEVEGANVSTKWIERQQRLLHIRNRASSAPQFDFISPNILNRSHDDQCAQQVHDLSADPFHMFHY